MSSIGVVVVLKCNLNSFSLQVARNSKIFDGFDASQLFKEFNASHELHG